MCALGGSEGVPSSGRPPRWAGGSGQPGRAAKSSRRVWKVEKERRESERTTLGRTPPKNKTKMPALAPARRPLRPGVTSRPCLPTRPPPLLAAAGAAWGARGSSSRPVAVAAGAAPAASNSSPSPAPPAAWDGTAVVIVDHGSRRAASNAQLDEMVAMYK